MFISTALNTLANRTIILAQDYGTLPNSGFSGAELADAGREFLTPIVIVVVIVVAIVAFMSRQLSTLVPVIIGGLIAVGLLLNPSLVATIGGGIAGLLPGA